MVPNAGGNKPLLAVQRLISELDEARAALAEAREERYPPIPPNGSAARSLGAYLADVLCEDQWARAEEMLLGIHAAYVALRAENEALRTALAMMYDKWVDGDDCYEEPDTFSGFLGKAFQLSITEEDHVISLLGKDCPTRAIDAAIAKEQPCE